MSDKILVEAKLFNGLLKAIEVHLEILQEGEIFIENPILLNKIINSVEILRDNYNKINSMDNDIKKMKRRAYSNYIKAKSDYEKALFNKDHANINIFKEKKDICLELYLNLKKVAE